MIEMNMINAIIRAQSKLVILGETHLSSSEHIISPQTTQNPTNKNLISSETVSCNSNVEVDKFINKSRRNLTKLRSVFPLRFLFCFVFVLNYTQKINIQWMDTIRIPLRTCHIGSYRGNLNNKNIYLIEKSCWRKNELGFIVGKRNCIFGHYWLIVVWPFRNFFEE